MPSLKLWPFRSRVGCDLAPAKAHLDLALETEEALELQLDEPWEALELQLAGPRPLALEPFGWGPDMLLHRGSQELRPISNRQRTRWLWERSQAFRWIWFRCLQPLFLTKSFSQIL